MEYPDEILGALEVLKLGKLKGKHKELVCELIKEIPDAYTVFLNDNNSVFSLVNLSRTLVKHKKMGKGTLEKIDELVIVCSSGETHKPVKKEQVEKKEAPSRDLHAHVKAFSGAALPTEGLANLPSGTVHKKAKVENRELAPSEYVQHVGSEKELGRFQNAVETVDKFIEVKSIGSLEKSIVKGMKALYQYSFPNQDEAEPWKLIVDRIKDMKKIDELDPAYGDMVRRLIELEHVENGKRGRQKLKKEGRLEDLESLRQEMSKNKDMETLHSLLSQYGDSRFRVFIAMSGDAVVGYTQVSVMPVVYKDTEGQEKRSMVVFGQYRCIADDKFMKKEYGRSENFREEGIASAFYVFRHGVAAEDAKKLGYKDGVVGTILEAEFIGQGESTDDIKFTKTRLGVHRRMGAKAMMLETDDGLVTVHKQPRLDESSNPIYLHICFRPLRYEEGDLTRTTEIDKDLAKAIMMSFIDNFDREGFAKKDVEEARRDIESRFARAKRVILVPPEELPTYVELAKVYAPLKEQLERDLGPIDAHEIKVKAALAELDAGKESAHRLGS